MVVGGLWVSKWKETFFLKACMRNIGKPFLIFMLILTRIFYSKKIFNKYNMFNLLKIYIQSYMYTRYALELKLYVKFVCFSYLQTFDFSGKLLNRVSIEICVKRNSQKWTNEIVKNFCEFWCIFEKIFDLIFAIFLFNFCSINSKMSKILTNLAKILNEFCKSFERKFSLDERNVRERN